MVGNNNDPAKDSFGVINGKLIIASWISPIALTSNIGAFTFFSDSISNDVILFFKSNTLLFFSLTFCSISVTFACSCSFIVFTNEFKLFKNRWSKYPSSWWIDDINACLIIWFAFWSNLISNKSIFAGLLFALVFVKLPITVLSRFKKKHLEKENLLVMVEFEFKLLQYNNRPSVNNTGSCIRATRGPYVQLITSISERCGA